MCVSNNDAVAFGDVVVVDAIDAEVLLVLDG